MIERAHSPVILERCALKPRQKIVERGNYVKKNRKRMHGYNFSI